MNCLSWKPKKHRKRAFLLLAPLALILFLSVGLFTNTVLATVYLSEDWENGIGAEWDQTNSPILTEEESVSTSHSLVYDNDYVFQDGLQSLSHGFIGFYCLVNNVTYSGGFKQDQVHARSGGGDLMGFTYMETDYGYTFTHWGVAWHNMLTNPYEITTNTSSVDVTIGSWQWIVLEYEQGDGWEYVGLWVDDVLASCINATTEQEFNMNSTIVGGQKYAGWSSFTFIDDVTYSDIYISEPESEPTPTPTPTATPTPTPTPTASPTASPSSEYWYQDQSSFLMVVAAIIVVVLFALFFYKKI